MPLAKNFTSVFEQEFEINFSQCYSNGKLKHTELCDLLQQTAAKHAEIGGISFEDMQQFDQAWVMTKLRIEIGDLPRCNDKIVIKTWIKSIENSKSVRAMEIFLQSQKIVSSETLWVVFNTKKRIAESILINYDHFELFPDRNATQSLPKNIYVPKQKTSTSYRQIVLSDIDNVNHVNNIKYLEWCLDLLDINLILDAKISSFEMNFLRELILNNSIEIGFLREDSAVIFSGSKENKNCFALQLNLKT
jgi:acyl-ACP thioesterase